jgi:hypothetical protein
MTHGYDTRHTNTAFLTGMRGRAHEQPRSALTGDLAEVVPLRPARSGPARDGAARVGALASMDAGNRVCVAKAATAAGWSEGSPIIVTCVPGRVVARPGTPSERTEHASAFVGGRLTLPVTARACLAISPGDQIVITTVPGEDCLLIVAAADVLQQLTGPVAEPEPGACAAPELAALDAPARRRSSVKPAWQEDSAGVR